MSKLQVGRVFLSHTFAKKKVWTKMFRVGRSDIDVHTYKSIHNPKQGDGRDLFLVFWKGLFYILIHLYKNPAFNGGPDDIFYILKGSVSFCKYYVCKSSHHIGNSNIVQGNYVYFTSFGEIIFILLPHNTYHK